MADAPLKLIRFDPPKQLDNQASPAVSSCLDPCSSQHAAYTDASGNIHYVYLDCAAHAVLPLACFAIQYQEVPAQPPLIINPSSRPSPQLLRDPLQDFTLIPNMPGELLLVQHNSCRVLHAVLPRQLGQAAPLSVFGTHQALAKVVITNGSVAVSGDAAGQLKMWRMLDAQLLDTHDPAAATTITAVCFIGPLLVAAATYGGQVTVLDIATGRLLPVQRWQAGPGPVSCLSAFSEPAQLAAAALAPFPRGPDGGGLLPSSGRRMENSSSAVPSPLLCVASRSGWLRLYTGAGSSARGWKLLAARDTLQGVAAVAFSPWGDTLAVASCAAQLLSSPAAAVAATGQQPGTLSLYELTADSATPERTLPGAEGGVAEGGLSLRLFHQWVVKAQPVGVDFLASCKQQWLDGKRLMALQALDLLAVPASTGALVLTATKPMQMAQQHRQQQHQQQEVEGVSSLLNSVNLSKGGPSDAAMLSADRAAMQGTTSAAAASSSRPENIALGVGEGATPPTAAARSRLAGSVQGASIHSPTGDVEPDLAQRGLDQVAASIASAMPLAESPTHKALTARTLEDAHDWTTADAAAAPAAPAQGEAAAAPPEGGAGAVGGIQLGEAGPDLNTPAAAAAAAVAPGEGAAAADVSRPAHAQAGRGLSAPAASSSGTSGLWCPSTLPAARHWRQADADALAAEQSRSELHARLQQEQAAFMARRQAQAAASTVPVATAQAGPGSPTPPLAAAAGNDDEQELPSSSTFHMLQPGQGTAWDLPGEQEAGPAVSSQQLHQPQPPVAAAAPGAAHRSAMASPIRAHSRSVTFANSSTAAAAGSQQLPAPQQPTQPAPAPVPLHPGAVAATATAVADAPGTVYKWPLRQAPAAGQDDEEEPQPRVLPAQLSGSHAAAAAAGGGGGGGGGIRHATNTSSSSRLPRVPAAAAPADGLPAGLAVQPAAARSTHAPTPATSAAPAAHPADTGDIAEELHPDLQCGRPRQAAAEPAVPDPQPVAPQPAAKHGLRPSGSSSRAAASATTAFAGSLAAAAAAAATAAAATAVVPGGALAQPSLNSTVLLQKRIQSLEAAPQIPLDPSSEVVRQLAAQRTGNAPPDATLFDVEPLRDITTPLRANKLIGKQVDARWVASRSLKPHMSDLWDPEAWQTEAADTRCLVLPKQPAVVQVVRQLLALR